MAHGGASGEELELDRELTTGSSNLDRMLPTLRRRACLCSLTDCSERFQTALEKVRRKLRFPANFAEILVK
jgi:hypothetical protein